MKRIYTSALAVFVALAAYAQEPTLTLDYPVACEGADVMATLSMPEFSLLSSATGANEQNGVMFDLVGVEGATIKGFTVDVNQNNTDFEIYYRTGSYVGFEDNAIGWTLLGSSSGVGMGTGVNTGVELDLVILPGQTLGFYVTCTGVSQFLGYATGTVVGTTLASNGYLTMNSGVGKVYPFGTTYTPRDFIGAVLYEPIPTDIVWSDNVSTDLTATYTVDRSMGVIATMTYGGFEHKGADFVEVHSYDVEATATPAVLGWDQSSTLTTNITHSKGLGTTFAAGNNQSGAMFDITGTNAIEIQGFSVYPVGTATTADVEVFYKTGTFVGSETDAGDWTSIGTATGLVGEQDNYVALTTPLAVAPGQTMGIHITRTDGVGANLYYSNSSPVGTVFTSDANLSIKSGTGIVAPFATAYPDRMLNTIVHYEAENPAGLNYSWAPTGGTGGSALVTPNSDVTYTVTVDDGVCEGTGDVSVSMALGIEDDLAAGIAVYPNPATDNITLQAEQPLNVEHIVLMDLSGKAVYQLVPSGTFTTATIPVSQLATGMYLLQLNIDGQLTNRKVVVR